jgi:hypothetical protein
LRLSVRLMGFVEMTQLRAKASREADLRRGK